MNDSQVRATTQTIIKILSKNRRVLPGALHCQHSRYEDCLEPHINKINALVAAKKPISLVLPAFPAKSPNGNKTCSVLPDLGERMALHAIEQLCLEIEKNYRAGAEVVICSDGRVFNDLVNVSDKDVDAYANEINNIIREDALVHIATFSLDDYYNGSSYHDMREMLVREFAEPLMFVKQKVKLHEDSKALFNGIHRFIYEDQLSLVTSMSKNQIRVLSKEITYRVIQRSNAWSQFVSLHFPSSIRLSIHPQPCGSEKLGIMLLKSQDVWATPWHRVVLKEGDQQVLVRRIEAEEMGADPVYVNNQFSHYERRHDH